MELEVEVAIDAPAATAWAVIGEQFGRIGEWATPITSSRLDREPGIGAVRDCHIARFGPVKPGVVRERLILFDPAAMSFAYEAVDGMPKFVARAINRWSVEPLDSHRCVVRMRATLELRGWARLFGFLLGPRMQRDGARVLEELRYQAEHGIPHPRKRRAMARRNAATVRG